MEHKTIDLDFILKHEFIHDNKNEIEYFKENKILLDFINKKEVILDTNIKEPEQQIKNLIFDNLCFDKFCFSNEKFKNDIIEINKEHIFVFDNAALTKHYLKNIKIIFQNIEYKIYIPFIYLAEQTIITEKNLNHMQIDIQSKFGESNVIIPIIMENNELNNFYKEIADNIGLIKKNNDKYKLLNYNLFNKSFYIEKNNKKNKSIKELNNIQNNFYDEKKKEVDYLYIYLSENKDKNIFFNKHFKKAYTLLNKFYKLSDILKKEKIDEFIFHKIIKKIVFSLKEARDTYYFIEIKKYQEIKKKSNFVFITTDEISNVRCVINRISSINIYNGIPRYINYINNNKYYLKLYDMYHLFTNKYINNEFLPNNNNNYYVNSNKIFLEHAVSILTKKINLIGGEKSENIFLDIFNKDNKKMIYNNYNENNNIINSKKIDENINRIYNKENILLQMNNKEIIEEKLKTYIKKFYEIYYTLFVKQTIIKTSIKYGSGDIKVVNLINEINVIFDNLIALYKENIPENKENKTNEYHKFYEVTGKNIIKFIDNLDFTRYEEDDNHVISNLNNSFKERIKYFIEYDSKDYNEHFTRYFPNPEKGIESLFVVYCIYKMIIYENRSEIFSFFQEVFSKYFDKYPIMSLYHIFYSNYSIEENKKNYIEYYDLEKHCYDINDVDRFYEDYPMIKTFDDFCKSDLFDEDNI